MTSDEELRDQTEARLIRGYLAKATPQERHLFVMRSNYDDNAAILDDLINDPSTGKATALAIYWNLGAAWLAHYANLDDAASHERDDFRRTRLIEERYLHGFYHDTDIWFDPMHSEGGRPDDYPERTIAHPIPQDMLTAVGSEVVDLDQEDYDDGLPYALAEEISALYED